MSRLVVPEWHQWANCQGSDVEQFYPEKGGRSIHAQRICARCEVRAECLEWALEHGEQGIWGGVSEHERKQMRRDRRAA